MVKQNAKETSADQGAAELWPRKVHEDLEPGLVDKRRVRHDESYADGYEQHAHECGLGPIEPIEWVVHVLDPLYQTCVWGHRLRSLQLLGLAERAGWERLLGHVACRHGQSSSPPTSSAVAVDLRVDRRAVPVETTAGHTETLGAIT